MKIRMGVNKKILTFLPIQSALTVYKRTNISITENDIPENNDNSGRPPEKESAEDCKSAEPYTNTLEGLQVIIKNNASQK